MTVKAAMQLKRGDKVYLTRDPRTWKVLDVRPEEQRVVFETRDGPVNRMELCGAAALRSLKVPR